MGEDGSMSSEQPVPQREEPHDTATVAPGGDAAAGDDQRHSTTYTLYSVYARAEEPGANAADCTAELDELVGELAAQDVVIRGFYDVSGLRADADLMIWWHAPSAEVLQAAARRFRRTALGRALEGTWSAMGVHRTAEFNKAHIPAFLAGLPAQRWLSVYPFVRSYDWYLLPDAERREMLREHGVMGREYDQVLANTTAAFSLGDYEWLLALESADLHDIVDLMRHLRSSEARRHVREEVPFFTGRRIEIDEIHEVLL